MKIWKLFFVLVVFLAASSFAFANVFEIIQSVPVETNLEVQGIRHAKDVWPQMIREAKESIYLEMFYATNDANSTNDPVLNNVTDQIIEAAKRGVKVKLLVDSKMYKSNKQIPQQLSSIKNIEVKTISFEKLTGGIQHAKFFIIDGKKFFLGSQNYDWRALIHIHEVGLLSDDAIALNGLQKIFQFDWDAGEATELKPLSSTKLKIKSKKAGKSNENRTIFLASPESFLPQNTTTTISEYLRQIKSATKSIYLQTYDYGIHLFGKPDEWLILQNALIEAAKRGLDVKLLVDVKSMKNESKALLALQSAGVSVRVVTIPEWSGGKIPYARLVHSKYIIFDGKTAWIGSENLSGSYFIDSRNVGIIFANELAVVNLGLIFTKAWNSSYAKKINSD